ncbi:MAG: leucine-rich repeat domain-containing protein, partial [Oscillospiraceae bacterium]|nr:leucine-rich repeat domain-containing protein [Oscillospiraceae bacterium]
MKKRRNLCAVLLMVLALIFMFTVTAGAEEITEGEQTEPVVVDSGECGAEGDNVLWTLYSDGVLEITGTGAMEDFYSGSAPWFEYRIGTNSSTVITSIVIKSGVTRIGNWAFNQLSLQDATVPGTVETIGNHAFYFCKQLTSLTLPVGVIELEEYAFNDCSNLAYVSLPEGLEIIGSHAFGSTALTDIVIPGTVKEIGSFAFYNTKLTGVNIPASVTTIGEAAF